MPAGRTLRQRAAAIDNLVDLRRGCRGQRKGRQASGRRCSGLVGPDVLINTAGGDPGAVVRSSIAAAGPTSPRPWACTFGPLHDDGGSPHAFPRRRAHRQHRLIGGKIPMPQLAPIAPVVRSGRALGGKCAVAPVRQTSSSRLSVPWLMRTGRTFNAQFKGKHKQTFAAEFAIADSPPGFGSGGAGGEADLQAVSKVAESNHRAARPAHQAERALPESLLPPDLMESSCPDQPSKMEKCCTPAGRVRLPGPAAADAAGGSGDGAK